MSELLTQEELENRLFNVTKRHDDGDVAALRDHIEALAEEVGRLKDRVEDHHATAHRTVDTTRRAIDKAANFKAQRDELARALLKSEYGVYDDHGDCSFCSGIDSHKPDCIVREAKELLK